MPLAPRPAPGPDRESRKRTPRNRTAHYATIIVSGALAMGVGAWLVVMGRG